ncbi:MAG: DUF2946 family protein [Xanthomonadales bacterium]|nr:DUF2946 family protein [Xanthomonadales bacterium]
MLALTAALLLALLPTLGRLHRGLDSDPLGPGWVALCTSQGLVLRWVDPTGSAGDGEPSSPMQHAGDECPYCPLLATTRLPATAAPVWLKLQPATFLAPQAVEAGFGKPLVSGWSPRGPPILVRA